MRGMEDVACPVIRLEAVAKSTVAAANTGGCSLERPIRNYCVWRWQVEGRTVSALT